LPDYSMMRNAQHMWFFRLILGPSALRVAI
jgi:hypothetical protein